MNRIKRNDLLFYIAWTLFLFSILAEYTIWFEQGYANILLKITKFIRYLAYAICCLKIILETYQTNVFARCVLCGSIFLMSCLGSGNRTMILYLLILLAAIDVDSTESIRIANKIQILFLCTLIILSLTGLATDYIFDSYSRRRHGLGFSWATTAPILYFYIMLSYIYLKQEKITFVNYFFLEGINIWIYKMTDARMAFTLSSLFLLFFCIESFFKHPWKYWKKIGHFYYMAPAVICMTALTIYWKYDEKNVIWKSLNSLLSNRLYLGKNAILTYGITLFGQKINWIGFSLKRPTASVAVGYNYVDCSYLQLLLEYGLLFLIIVIMIYSIAMYQSVKKKDYYLIWILLFILIFGITEPRLMNFAFNPFPVVAFGSLNISKQERRWKIINGNERKNVTCEMRREF